MIRSLLKYLSPVVTNSTLLTKGLLTSCVFYILDTSDVNDAEIFDAKPRLLVIDAESS